jgi:hypothetical protein
MSMARDARRRISPIEIEAIDRSTAAEVFRRFFRATALLGWIAQQNQIGLAISSAVIALSSFTGGIAAENAAPETDAHAPARIAPRFPRFRSSAFPWAAPS